MSVYPDSVAIEMMLNGSTWTDVSADVVGSLSCTYGNPSSAPQDRVAQTGVLTFAMNNSERNSALTRGYYTPGGASCRAGFAVGCPVRVLVTFEGDPRVKFYGRITPGGIYVEPGVKGSRLVTVEVHDFMEQMATSELDQQTIYPNVEMWEAVPLLCGMMAIQPQYFELNDCEDTFPYIFDDTRAGTVALTEAAKFALSELGYIYVKFGVGETLAVDGRKTRKNRAAQQIPMDPATVGLLLMEDGDNLLTETSDNFQLNDSEAVDLTDQMHSLVVNPRLLANLVSVTLHPRTRDAAATSVLWSNQSELTIAAGATVNLEGNYRNPTGGGAACGVDMVKPAATTDYTMFSATFGGGSNITSDLEVAAVFKTDKVTLALTNNNASTGYINKLQVRGRGIYKYDGSSAVSSDANSIAAYGKYSLKMDMNYNVDVAAAQTIADKLKSFYKDLATTASESYWHANRSRALMCAFLAFEPGTRVTITETMSEIDADYFINGVNYTITPGANRWAIDFGWYIKPAAEEDF